MCHGRFQNADEFNFQRAAADQKGKGGVADSQLPEMVVLFRGHHLLTWLGDCRNLDHATGKSFNFVSVEADFAGRKSKFMDQSTTDILSKCRRGDSKQGQSFPTRDELPPLPWLVLDYSHDFCLVTGWDLQIL
jgi:hypothetical protein